MPIIFALTVEALLYMALSLAFIPRVGWVGCAVAVLGLGLATAWVSTALTLYLLGAALGAPTSFRDALVETAGRPLGRMLWTNVLIHGATLLGLVCFIVPGVWIFVRYNILAMPVVVGERLSGMAAIRRAGALSDGHFGLLCRQALWILFVIGCVGFAAGIARDALPSRLGFIVVAAVTAAATEALFRIWSIRCFLGLASGIGYREPIAPPPRIGALATGAAVMVFALAVTASSERIFVRAFWIPAGSMMPTMLIGDSFYVDMTAYGVRVPGTATRVWPRGPQRGDLVVFVSPVDNETALVKRVVATAGDTVEIRNKQLLLEGTPIVEPYAHFEDPNAATGSRDNFGPITVPQGKFFVLGDNRDRSYDSRFWGFADEAGLIGQISWIYWSRDRETGDVRWQRIGMTPR